MAGKKHGRRARGRDADAPRRSGPRSGPRAKGESEGRLLDAAEERFAAAGFEGTRLDEVAEAVGVRRQTLLHYFPTKAALHAAVIERAFFMLSHALMKADAPEGEGATAAARIDGLARTWLGHLRARPTFAALILREVLDGHGPGRDLILKHALPLLEDLERWVSKAGGGGGKASVRSALLALAASTLVRVASGSLERPLWGDVDDTAALARILVDLEPMSSGRAGRSGSARRRR